MMNLGLTDIHIIYKADKQQGPHGELYPIFCNNLYGKESKKEDINIHMYVHIYN